MHDMTSTKPRFYIGTSGWSYDHWKGLFYPDDLPKSKWFEYYAQQFSTVEVNATFYRIFKRQTYLKWYDQAPPDFRYVFKAPRLITHRRYLKDVDGIIRNFWRSVWQVREKLGLILLQLPPKMPYEPRLLKNALLAFRDPARVAVEFRSREWFCDEIRELLCEVGAVFCASDSPKTKLLDWVTSEAGYIRLHGRTQWYRYNYSDEELRKIADLGRRMHAEGAREVYIFFNNDFEGNAPRNALALKKILDE